MNTLTQVAQTYLAIFSSYFHQFLQWGEWLFYSLLVIQIVWMTLWYAFDYASFSESMSGFIKRFFVITFFYSIMSNPSWLAEILKTTLFMGKTLTNTSLDPSSLISIGIAIGNKIIIPIEKTNLLSTGFSSVLILIVYAWVVFVFLSVAIDLAITLIVTTALIAAATFFLGFSALETTAHIARQTLNIILENCFKLLGLYLVVGATNRTVPLLVNCIPKEMMNFDAYVWIIAIALLFWSLARNLPRQFAKIASNAIQDSQPQKNTASNSSDYVFSSRPIVSSHLNENIQLNTHATNSSMNHPINEVGAVNSLSEQFKNIHQRQRTEGK